MAIPVLVIGKSGSGKSASLRNFPNNEYALINVLGKPLSFKSDKKYLEGDNYEDIQAGLLTYASKTNAIVIDDAGYLITNHFMRENAIEKKGNAQFQMYNDIANKFFNLIRFIVTQLPKNIVVYVFMHEEKNDIGEIKPKTVGKLLDEKVSIEGMFTVVLHSVKSSGGYIFRTQTDGLSVTKTPFDMFEEKEIDNDLYVVHQAIEKYYNIGGKHE